MSDLPQTGVGSNLPLHDPLDRAYQALGRILDNVIVLRVTTVVGTVTAANVGDPLTATAITAAPDGQLVAHSAMNMALGDADVVISKGFLDDAALMALHTQALADSRAIRKDSIDLLRAAIESLLSRPSR